MGSDHHRVFMYTPDLSVSNQKDSPPQETAILGDATDLSLCKEQQKCSDFFKQKRSRQMAIGALPVLKASWFLFSTLA
jgi:hypothetical protein